jgi:hypothetical protein
MKVLGSENAECGVRLNNVGLAIRPGIILPFVLWTFQNISFCPMTIVLPFPMRRVQFCIILEECI